MDVQETSLYWFENDVKMYGTQTRVLKELLRNSFENDVKMYGTQTSKTVLAVPPWFENDVKMYGTQTEFQLYR